MAVKYNYSNKDKRRVIIRLTACRTKLTYETVKDPGASSGLFGCCKIGKAKRSVPLSVFHGVLFGGFSKTF